MKSMTKLAAAIALATGVVSALPAMAADEVGVSANAGFMTDYYFRGVKLGDAGAFGGADVEYAGFYAGVWAADDDGLANDSSESGLETDFYAGYGFEFENGVALGVGYARYEYTYTADYEDEYSLSASFSGFEVTYVDGVDHQEENVGELDADYTVMTLGYSGEIFGVVYGKYENEEDNTGIEYKYDYVEVSASGEVASLDVTATLGKTRNIDDDSDPTADSSGDGYFTLAVSKSFDL